MDTKPPNSQPPVENLTNIGTCAKMIPIPLKSAPDPTSPPFIDYSQYYSWWKCPWLWYERTVKRRRRCHSGTYRTDPLTIGSLVHAGLEVWQQEHQPKIPPTLIEELRPSPETLTMCQMMVLGYTRAFPGEYWPKIHCEHPIRWPLGGAAPQWDGLAKIDMWYEVPEATNIASGIDGYECYLTPGIWINEYKTKSDALSMGLFMQRWEVNMQASFQHLALQHHIGSPIQGILLNVIEKPRVYMPKRKCKGCSQQFDLTAWLPAGPNDNPSHSTCPSCHTVQQLNKGNTAPTFSNPRYYRFAVHRSPERLRTDEQQIAAVAEQMQEAISNGGPSPLLPNTEACVDTRFGACEYFSPHTYGGDTLDNPDFEDIPDYVQEKTT